MKSLERKKREGFRTQGVESPGSIAEHILTTVHLARIIGYYEGADIAKCINMALFHDNGEARIGDIDKFSEKYLGKPIEAEKKAIEDQVKRLPKELGNEMVSLFIEKEERKTLEAKVVQDADWIECAAQAKIYSDRGYKEFMAWIEDIENSVATNTAKELVKELKKTDNFVSSYIEKNQDRPLG